MIKDRFLCMALQTYLQTKDRYAHCHIRLCCAIFVFSLSLDRAEKSNTSQMIRRYLSLSSGAKCPSSTGISSTCLVYERSKSLPSPQGIHNIKVNITMVAIITNQSMNYIFLVVIVNIRLLPTKSWIFITELFMVRLKSIIVISVVIKYQIRIV